MNDMANKRGQIKKITKHLMESWEILKVPFGIFKSHSGQFYQLCTNLLEEFFSKAHCVSKVSMALGTKSPL